jgi:outer membrane protein TolC
MRKRLRRLLCAALLPAVLLPLATAAAQDNATKPVYDLSACVARGLEANPAIVAARADLFGADYARKAAIGDLLPTATAGYGYTHYDRQPAAGSGDRDQWGLHLNLSQPVFDGFNLLSKFQKAKLAKEQNEAKLAQAELTLIKSIQTNFFLLLKARMDVKSAKDSVERLKSQLAVTQAFYDVGLKPRLDVLQAEVDLATAQQNLLTAENTVSIQQAQLNTLLNLSVEAPAEYVGELLYTPFTLGLDDCLERAYKGRPDLTIGQKSVEMAEKDARITASAFYPTLTANADYYKYGNDPGVQGGSSFNVTAAEYWTAGASVNWKFFQWGSTFHNYKKDLETVANLRAQLNNTRLNAGFEVKQGLLNMKAAADRIGVARKSVEAARESYRMAVARYQAQVGTNTDVLDAQSRVSSSEAQLNQALSDYQTAMAGLYVSMGEKNPSLNH